MTEEQPKGLLADLISEAACGRLCGFYQDIPDEVYQDPRCPGWRSTTVKLIADTSFAHHQLSTHKETPALLRGRRFHAYMEAGGLPDLDAAEERKFSRMLGAVRAHPQARRLYENATREVTAWATCPRTGLLLRIRMDLYHHDIPGWDGAPFSDYKTTRSAAPGSFARDARTYGYPFSMAFYAHVFSLCVGEQCAPPNLIAVEHEPPYGVNVFPISRKSLDYEAVRLDRALDRIVRADGGRGWTGYDTNHDLEL